MGWLIALVCVSAYVYIGIALARRLRKMDGGTEYDDWNDDMVFGMAAMLWPLAVAFALLAWIGKVTR